MDTDAILWMLVRVVLFASWSLPIPYLTQTYIWSVCEEISDDQAQQDQILIKTVAVICALFWPILVVVAMVQLLFTKEAK